jgi:hypothetical protein
MKFEELQQGGGSHVVFKLCKGRDFVACLALTENSENGNYVHIRKLTFITENPADNIRPG